MAMIKYRYLHWKGTYHSEFYVILLLPDTTTNYYLSRGALEFAATIKCWANGTTFNRNKPQNACFDFLCTFI
jgi:hypothetical protein